jgi:hypothetical protein
MRCPSCGSSHLRLSHWKVSDLFFLLTLRFPARCWLCRERTRVSILQALTIRRLQKKEHHAHAKHGASRKTPI